MSYTKQHFYTNQTLKAEHLNNIEDGIVANEAAIADKQPKGNYLTTEVAANTYQPKGNYLTQYQTLKTINGQSIVGNGNIDVSSNNTTTFLIPQPVDKSTYSGKKIVCIGDSVTYGYGVSTGYVPRLGTELGATMVNHGVSGTVLCTGGHRTCNISKLSEGALSGANYVLIMMGVNDWDQARANYYSLGTIDTDDTTTIYGALKMWCDKIMELKQTSALSKTKFYFMTPPITSWNNSMGSTQDWNQAKTNIHGYVFRQLCEAIIEVASMYSIPVIDVNKFCGIYYNSAEDQNATIYGGDGIHPNDDGHELIKDCIVRMLLQNPEYVSDSEAINYSLNHLLAQVAETLETEITYPVKTVEKVAIEIPVTGITLTKSSLSLEAGGTYTVGASLIPANTTQTSIAWESSNVSVAKVNGGVITAIAEGSAIITCKSVNNPSVKATVALTVTAAASTDLTALVISEDAATVESGSTKTLTVTYVPSNTAQTGVTWETTDSSIASIQPSSDGRSCTVTANNVGQCYIRVKSTVNTNISAQCFFTTSEVSSGGGDIEIDDSVKTLTFSTSADTTWNANTGVVSCTANPNEPLLNNGGTSNTAILNQAIGKGQELEVQFDTIPATTYSSANGNSWSIMTVGLDRASDIASVGKDGGYNFPQPDINIYFDHPGKEQNGQKQICAFKPNNKLAKLYYGVSVHDETNTGLRITYKRDTNGAVTIIANGVNVPLDAIRAQMDTINLAEAADNLYFVVSGLSKTTQMTVKYYGDLR